MKLSYVLLSYIKYLIKRQSKYTIHSPFVFDFLTNGIQLDIDRNQVDKLIPTGVSTEKVRLILRILKFFDCQQALLICDKACVEEKIFEYAVNHDLKRKIEGLKGVLLQDYQIVYVNQSQLNHQIMCFEQLKPLVDNNTILMFDGIRQSKSSEEAWAKIYADNQITVSIDLFHVGLVFFNQDLSKQHFIL